MSKYRFEKMREAVGKFAEHIGDPRLREMFLKCFFSTIDTTLSESEGLPFVVTGDIPAMWLRDSVAQVLQYIPYAAECEETAELIRGLAERQFGFIALDPYANAFNSEPNGKGHVGDICDAYSPWVWERKYELDSLCYPFFLAQKYYNATQDERIFSSAYQAAAKSALDVMEREQRPVNSSYRHRRFGKGTHITDTLINCGKGGVCEYTGMIRSCYRPSDDACVFGFNVPENMFAYTALGCLAEGLYKLGNAADAARAVKLRGEVKSGIEKFGIINEDGETFYAYEVDGLGNALFMDDANVPSLLAAPFLGFCSPDDALYLCTRKKILSHRNPYWFEGKAACGVGSPHTPDGYIWHIGLCVQALTSQDENEIRGILQILRDTEAGTLCMHEGFDCDDPCKYTRPWFAWANSMFALLLYEKIEVLSKCRI